MVEDLFILADYSLVTVPHKTSRPFRCAPRKNRLRTPTPRASDPLDTECFIHIIKRGGSCGTALREPFLISHLSSPIRHRQYVLTESIWSEKEKNQDLKEKKVQKFAVSNEKQ